MKFAGFNGNAKGSVNFLFNCNLDYRLCLSLTSKENRGESLHPDAKVRRITTMEKAQIGQIAPYIEDLEKDLDERVYRGLPTLGDLNRMYEITKQLIDTAFGRRYWIFRVAGF
jgi:hypothetical protein